MAAQPQLAKLPDNSVHHLIPDCHQPLAAEIRYVARQPILDRRSRVLGYELLFWNGHAPAFHGETELAIKAVLDNAIIFGLEQLASGLPAFVDCPIELLTEDWARVLPPSLTVVELKEEASPSPSLIASCRRLKELGFRLALDDYAGLSGSKPLLELVDYVKVDIAKVSAADRAKLPALLDGIAARSVAKNVETQEQYRQVSGEGFELFQGYFFCRPEPAKSRRIPGNRLVHLEILEVLQKNPTDVHRLSQLVMCDAALTYSFLRLVNSPVCAMRQEVTSIKSALMLLGEETSRRVAMLAIASDFNTDQPPELLRMAFERGRFCELGAGYVGLVPTEQYLIGMVSMFPAMLRISMDDLAKSLPLREEARDALLGKGNREGVLLDWLVCQDRGDWAGCDALILANGLHYEQVMRCRAEAVTWTNAALKSAL
jgi:EAL and modified HD-GYP domain-containing signal transduction protein